MEYNDCLICLESTLSSMFIQCKSCNNKYCFKLY